MYTIILWLYFAQVLNMYNHKIISTCIIINIAYKKCMTIKTLSEYNNFVYSEQKNV